MNNPVARMGIIIATIVICVFLVLVLFLNQMDKNSKNSNEPVSAATEQTEDGSKTDAAAEADAAKPAEDAAAAAQEEKDATVAAAEPPPAPSVEMDIPSLKDVFKDYFPIGAAIEPDETAGLHADLLKKQVNWLVAENVMKPDAIEPSEGNFNWTNADKLVAFAKENGMQLRFHTLVWHNQVGGWFFQDENGNSMVDETDPKKREANKKLLLKRLDNHVRTIVSRYKDDIKSWDVVNEVIEPGDPDGMRASNWYKIAGVDFIETAFRAAREAGGPDIKLYINDYSTDDITKRDRLYELVKSMLDKGVPIDGVGHQTHISVAGPSVFSIIDSMKKFAELGLDNIVTELDMSLYAWNDRSDYGDDIPAYVLRSQADKYRELFDAFKENKDILSGVMFWGITDEHSWLNTFPVTRTDAPLLFDRQLHAKQAFWAIVDPSKLPQ
ncbi:endo-1,4-beta-xylanase [Paenibacillus cellulosilyticus]|uniref:Beta-xylanase n=1 Tax=Paenibacillus cellulosilyticus TaxID=375489 RepID=A0A2V2YZI8_9BACL|nr:endo-1,4-beta-xylanase [Paenibacillus cellulosilyticus]PWW07207.1 endo-1,4-beta-xylanase [Paenibacillus cellulosilyticus]